MEKRIDLKDWKPMGDLVKLIYTDNDEFYIKKEDFNRAFGPIVSGNKADIKKEYKVKIED